MIGIRFNEPTLAIQHLVEVTRELLWNTSFPGPGEVELSERALIKGLGRRHGRKLEENCV